MLFCYCSAEEEKPSDHSPWTSETWEETDYICYIDET